ncbi:unnamed protein product [Paramecium primaurelia]|uniref:Uncharacterized protein n=1 Tax=Paramecium primaurelia TaxID=5886 RepID=A0A8S1KTG3_PARPR|nr:unnamed protein product [Paramecium primaurelia]
MRQMTKAMDSCFEDEMFQIKQLISQLRQSEVNFYDQRLQYDTQILQEWEIYKESQIKKIIHETMNSSSPDFKICLCEFAQNKRLSIEIWIKVAYDVFYDELDGNELRMKFWTYFKKKYFTLRDELMTKEWPDQWKYVEDEPCLCLDIIKVYEQYLPIRMLIAQNLNELAPNYLYVDVRRMPNLIEDNGLYLECTRKTWFPNLQLLSCDQLEKVYYSNTVFSHQILRFVVIIKKIVMPILQYFQERAEAGNVINIYGEQHEFMFEILQSLKALSGLAIRTADATLRVQKSFKQGSVDSRTKEDVCKVIISTLSQHDVNQEILQDIYDNLCQGYTTFYSDVYKHIKPYPKLIIMVSERKLSFKMSRSDDIQYHQIPDQMISDLLKTIDYQFLVYYVNLCFNKVMTLQQRSGQRKPFFQIMMLMWSYAVPLFFKNVKPELSDAKIFEYMETYEKLIEQENITIDLSDNELKQQFNEDDQDSKESESQQSEIQGDNMEITNLGKVVKKIRFY